MSDAPDVPADTGTPTPQSSSVSDTSLVRRVGEGCDDAADRLYRRYAARLRSVAERKLPADVAARVDADDIVQSVFRRFFQAARQGNYAAPTGDDLWHLLVVIALNRLRTVTTRQRAARRDSRRTVRPDSDRDDFGRCPTGGEGQPKAVLRLVIRDALERMPDAYREVVELRMEGYEVAEIAQRTGRSKRTVERTLQDVRQSLHDLLNEDS
jgi:RNA polymerase sigma-70 factor (ECF subfamily)